MDRGKGLSRRTPLAPGSKGLAPGKGLTPGKGLARVTPLARGTAPLARQEPAQQPRRRRVVPDVRMDVLVRSRGRCEVAVTDDCRRRRRQLEDRTIGASQHHRLPGRMGGSKRDGVHQATNLLQVCGHGTAGCHGWIESHRTEALANGWLLHDGQDPATVPVLLHDGRRVLLTADGYIEEETREH